MLQDCFGCRLTVTDPAALALYDQALEQLLTLAAEPAWQLQRATELDPGLLMGHVLQRRAAAQARYARALDAELDRTSQEYGAVVFAGGAVIRGATDLTGTVRARLDARLAAGAPP